MSALAEVFKILIQKGAKTIDQVPEDIREEVQKLLEKPEDK